MPASSLGVLPNDVEESSVEGFNAYYVEDAMISYVLLDSRFF